MARGGERVEMPAEGTWFPVAPRVRQRCCGCGLRHVWRFRLDPRRGIEAAIRVERRKAGRDSLARLVRIVSRHDGIPAGRAGYELWARRATGCRPENVCATMYCRAAGKLLARAERMGLVRHEQHGLAKLWYANKEVSGER